MTFQDKRRALFYERGVASIVPNDMIQARLIRLRSEGVLKKTISARTGISKSSLRHHETGIDQYGRIITECRRTTHDAIMRAQFTDADKARPSSLGALRMLRALYSAGYTTILLGQLLHRDNRQVWRWLNGHDGAHYIVAPIEREIREMYMKYRYADPVELGEDPHGIAYAQTAALKRGWPGPGCWDDDTIDDPEALPEYTGGPCGTMAGYRIHRREEVVIRKVGNRRQTICDACLMARNIVQKWPRLAELMGAGK